MAEVFTTEVLTFRRVLWNWRKCANVPFGDFGWLTTVLTNPTYYATLHFIHVFVKGKNTAATC